MRSAKAFSCGQLLANMPLAVMLVDFHGSPEHLRPSEHLLNDETGRLTPARRCMAFGEGALEAEVHACLVAATIPQSFRRASFGFADERVWSRAQAAKSDLISSDSDCLCSEPEGQISQAPARKQSVLQVIGCF